jgi:hypothetical protein
LWCHKATVVAYVASGSRPQGRPIQPGYPDSPPLAEHPVTPLWVNR